MAASALKRSPLTAATITPPSIDAQHSYKNVDRVDSTGSKRLSASSSTSSTSRISLDATSVLANVVSRAISPRRGSPATSPLPSPLEAPRGRKTSWDECFKKRDGYVSFPDFDQLRAEMEQRSREN